MPIALSMAVRLVRYPWFALALALALALAFAIGCADVEAPPAPEAAGALGSARQGLSDPAARRARSEAIRDVAAGRGMTNGALLAGIAQVETGLSHCWSEATWACQGPSSPSCGGPVIAGAADGPCSAQQGGLGMFQFDGGTYADTLARDGEEILLLEGNIDHAVDFVAERVRQEVAGVDSIAEAIEWLNAVPVEPGNAVFEQWIAIVSCRYNGCCGCSLQEAKYRNATVDAVGEFEPGFWDMTADPEPCEPIAAAGAVLEENDACAVPGGNPQYWRTVTDAGHGGRLLWTHTTDSDTTENFGRWNLAFETGGVYQLAVSTDGGTYAESTRAAYLIRHAGELTTAVVDQSAEDGFQVLGEFQFAAGGDQWVRVDDNTGEPLSTETRLAFDALRVTPVGGGDDPDDPGAPMDDPFADDPADPSAVDIAGGCRAAQAGGGNGSAALIALLGVALTLRRRPR